MQFFIYFNTRFKTWNFLNSKNVRDHVRKLPLGQITEHVPNVFLSSTGLKSFLISFEQQNIRHNLPRSCKRLLLALSSDKPICSIVQPSQEVVSLMLAIADGRNGLHCPQGMKILQDFVPLLFNT